LSDLVNGEDVVYCMELVNPMPNQGSVSTGGFMRAAGAIEAVVRLKAKPVFMYSPRVWKKAMGLNADKIVSLVKARELWPCDRAGAQLKRKRDNNRAEALLLAEYQRRLAYE